MFRFPYFFQTFEKHKYSKIYLYNMSNEKKNVRNTILKSKTRFRLFVLLHLYPELSLSLISEKMNRSKSTIRANSFPPSVPRGSISYNVFTPESRLTVTSNFFFKTSDVFATFFLDISYIPYISTIPINNFVSRESYLLLFRLRLFRAFRSKNNINKIKNQRLKSKMQNGKLKFKNICIAEKWTPFDFYIVILIFAF